MHHVHQVHHGNDANREHKIQRIVCNDFGESGSRLRAFSSDRGEVLHPISSIGFLFTGLSIRPTTWINRCQRRFSNLKPGYVPAPAVYSVSIEFLSSSSSIH
jgi:hypothetical protein